MPRIFVTGDALIDFVPTESALGPAFAPRCGGSNYNAAKAATHQGADVSFIGPLSTDMFGDRLVADLQASGVGIGLAARVPHPTTLAFVEYHGSDARYAFFNQGTTTQLADHASSEPGARSGDIVHVGSVSLIEDPGGANIVAFAERMSQDATLSLDPNARPGVIPDVDSWRDRINHLISLSGIVKLSDEDLALLSPGTPPAVFAADLISRGVALAVVTLGDAGALGATSKANVEVSGHSGPMVDTVGAGDTVTGTLLAALAGKSKTEIADMNEEALGTLLNRAMAAAWLNCQSTGCNPPNVSAIDAFLSD